MYVSLALHASGSSFLTVLGCLVPSLVRFQRFRSGWVYSRLLFKPLSFLCSLHPSAATHFLDLECFMLLSLGICCCCSWMGFISLYWNALVYSLFLVLFLFSFFVLSLLCVYELLRFIWNCEVGLGKIKLWSLSSF